jgi:CheY-like chemotaxis protein
VTDHPTILLADDSEDDVILIKRAFHKARLSAALIVVHNGEEAILYLSGFGRFADRTHFPMPDMFLLDLKMPIKDGFEVLRWIRTQPQLKELPVIVLTQSDRIKDANLAYQLGAYSFLVKGTDFNDAIAFARAVSDYLVKTRKNDDPHLPPAAWPPREKMSPHSGAPTYPDPASPGDPRPPIAP